LIRATETDRPAIESFLQAHAAHLMFPWSNLLRHGMDNEHPRAMSFWMAGDGQITDLLGLTTEGMIMPLCPNKAGDMGALLKGQAIMGLLGNAACVARIRAALGLGVAELDTVEPHYDLPLDRMIMPDVESLTLHPLDHAARDLLHAWRAAYAVESLAVPGEDARKRAVTDIERYIADDTHRVLYAGNEPVAMTGFNAMAPGVVQIGGVYTPPALRSRGYARKAVALHLAEARHWGVTRAILFAANEPAEKAYRAIGFEQIGGFSVVIYDKLQHV